MNQISARVTLEANDLRIAFVQSAWHADIVACGRDSFLEHMAELGVPHDAIDRFEVPGAYEIPLHSKVLAQSGRYRAVVACGFIVDGGIYRHEFVAQAVISGLMQVQLETAVPIFSVVLTPQQFHEHEAHRNFFHDHMIVKGIEAANACMRTLESLGRIRSLGGAPLRRTV